jgi:hypothetical protein
MAPTNPLQKQLDENRFLHGVNYVEQNASGIKRMSTSELAHLNQILTGNTDDPWRLEAASVTIPSGKTHQFNILSNPIHLARELLGTTHEMAGNGDNLEAAFRLYSQLVLLHLFRDANRRTAALGTLWLLRAHKVDADPKELANIDVGDLREQSDMSGLRDQLRALIK